MKSSSICLHLLCNVFLKLIYVLQTDCIFVFPLCYTEKERKWSHSVVSDSATPWTVGYQAPPSMEFSRQEYWSGLPFPSLVLYSRFSLIIYYFIHSSLMSVPIPHPPNLCPCISSLCLCLNFCFADKFICTIFYRFHISELYTIFVFLFLTDFTLYDSL